jgi:hypothetical protein
MNRVKYYKDLIIFFCGIGAGMILAANNFYDLSTLQKWLGCVGVIASVFFISLYDKIFALDKEGEKNE